KLEQRPSTPTNAAHFYSSYPSKRRHDSTPSSYAKYHTSLYEASPRLTPLHRLRMFDLYRRSSSSPIRTRPFVDGWKGTSPREPCARLIRRAEPGSLAICDSWVLRNHRPVTQNPQLLSTPNQIGRDLSPGI